MTAPYTLENAPPDIAPPARDEAGRAIRARTGVVICTMGHGDGHLLFYWKRRAREMMTGSWECRLCRNAAQARRNRRRRRVTPAPPAPVQPPDGCWTPRHPFDYTRVQLEATWGPYAGWTREQHRQHTLLLYQFLGWGPDAVRGVVVGRSVADSPAKAAA